MARAPKAADGQAAPAACPICRKPAASAFTPFCSKRCADVDLHRWMSGSYALPAEDVPDDEGGDSDA